MRDENTESKNKLKEIVKLMFGRNGDSKETVGIKTVDIKPPRVPSYINPGAPMSREEMSYFLIPATLEIEDARKVRVLEELFRRLESFLNDSRRFSYQTADAYKRIPVNLPVQMKVEKIQEQMRAIRFRLNIRDYEHEAERILLQNRLHELYAEAKVVDPVGTARYERMIDKQMRRAR